MFPTTLKKKSILIVLALFILCVPFSPIILGLAAKLVVMSQSQACTYCKCMKREMMRKHPEYETSKWSNNKKNTFLNGGGL